MDVGDLARADPYILRPRDFDDPNAGSAFQEFERRGVLLRVAWGAYVLVPEASRVPATTWRPPIEAVALGLASVVHGLKNVALVGPSAARVHGCLPRSLQMATASYPSTRTRDVTTLVGTVRLYARRIDTVDAVHFDSQFGRGMVSSVEMTMLDLASGVESKRWPIGGFDIAEAIRLLAAQSDWELVQDLAGHRRRAAAFTSVRRMGLGPE